MSSIASAPAAPSGAVARKVALFAAAALCLWLASPILGSGHLEEITANMKMIAISADRGDPMANDFLAPLVTEYHYHTRFGVVLLLQVVDRLFGASGDLGFRLLMLASFATVIGAALAIARRWGGVGVGAALLALTATPGVFENAFVFNDNLISAAFALGALALASEFDGLVAHLLAGALLAFAMACRFDALFAAPFLAGFVWLRHTRLVPLAARLVAAALGWKLVLIAIASATGVSPFDSYAFAKIFFPWSKLVDREWVAAYFFGAPVAILVILAATRRREPRPNVWKTWVVFALYPTLLVALAVLVVASEPRYIYPLLTPVVALYGGLGVERLVAGLRARGGEAFACRAAALAILLVAVAPPTATALWDGPRTVSGRLWSPLLWQRWQIAQQRSMRRIDEMVALAEATPTTLFLAEQYNDEFFLKMRLMEAGFRPLPVSQAFPDCRDGLATYARDGRIVAEIRTDNQYMRVGDTRPAVAAVQILRALDCPDVWRADRMIFTAVGEGSWDGVFDRDLFGPLFDRLEPKASFSQTFDLPLALLLSPATPSPAAPGERLAVRAGEIEWTPMSADDLKAVQAASERALVGHTLSYEQILDKYRPIFTRE